MLPLNDSAVIEITRHYRDDRAARSQVPLMNHIHEGCAILDSLQAPPDVLRAFCIHPLVQNDIPCKYYHSQAVMDLALEYKRVANSYLCRPNTDHIRTVKQLDEHLGKVSYPVLNMLLADKLQNNKDFFLYHVETHKRSTELTHYFALWLAYLQSKLYPL